MTVTEKSSRKLISGTGWTNPLTHDFELENSTHLKVYADDTLLVLGVNYTVSGVGSDSGYSVTISTPGVWTAVSTWVLSVEPPISQADDISLGGTYGARFEDGLDALTRRVQRLRDDARRAFKAPRTTVVGDAPTMDVLAEGEFWVADADGNMVRGGDAGDIANAQGYASAAAASAVDAAASAVDAQTAEDGAVAARAATEAALAAANMPPLAANTMIVDNAAGTLRQTKTFAQVRTLLSVPSIAGLPYYMASDYGVDPGNSASVNRAALQALIDIVGAANGGIIYIVGSIHYDAPLVFTGYKNVIIAGVAGRRIATTASQLYYDDPGSNSNGYTFDASYNCGFRDIRIICTTTGYTGALCNFNYVTGEVNFPYFERCELTMSFTVGATAKKVSLGGAVGARFIATSFDGGGIGVIGKTSLAGTTYYSNNVKFSDCSFHPGNEYCIMNPDRNWVFEGGYAQSSSQDGIGRFISQTTSDYVFEFLTIRDLTFFDVIASGTVWLYYLNGRHLVCENVDFGSALATSYGMILQSVVGFKISNCRQYTGSALVGFGSPAGSDPASNYGKIEMCEVTNCALTSNLVLHGGSQIMADTTNFVTVGGSGSVQRQFPMIGVPTSAPATSGLLWNDANTIKIVP